MASVKWIKINVDMFDDEKIKIIQSMPEGDALLVVWIKLITLAGKTNDSGYVYIAENMPYTDEMLSVIMNKPLNTIRLALDTFIKLGMIENDVKGIYLLNFEKHQSLDKLEKIKEQNRLRAKRFRDKQKSLPESIEDDVTLRITQSNAIDIDKDIEEDIDIEREEKKERKKKEKATGYDEIINQMLDNEEVKASVYEFIKMRKLIKKPMTDRALTMLINKLKKLSSDNNTQIKILEQSILKNWTDIYEYKGVNNNANSIKQPNKSSGSKYSQFS